MQPYRGSNRDTGLRISRGGICIILALSTLSLILSSISIINLFAHTEGPGHPSTFEFPSGTYRSDFDEDAYIWLDDREENVGYFKVYRKDHLHSKGGGGSSSPSANASVRFNNNVLSGATVPCCRYIAGGTRLEHTMDYDVDVWNDGSLTTSFVEQTFLRSASKWNAASGKNLYGTQHRRAGAGIRKNGRNQVAFGELNVGIDNALAVSAMWLRCSDAQYTISSCPTFLETYEWDMMYDFETYEWGDASRDSRLVDFETVVTHEFGHPTGLDDHSSPQSCQYSTMWGSVRIGDSSKRGVDSDSAQCARNLYSSSAPPPASSQPPPRGVGANISPSVLVIAFAIELFLVR